MNYKKITIIFIVVMIAIIAGYDVWVIASSGSENSISMTMIEWSYKYPVFTFAMGFVMGHLFWRVRDTDGTKLLGK